MGSGEYRAPRGDGDALAVAIRFLREHTGQALVLIYLAIAIMSRLYDVWFYQRFRVNILSYSDPQDFFLAPMRNPGTMMFVVVPAMIMIAISWLAAETISSIGRSCPRSASRRTSLSASARDRSL